MTGKAGDVKACTFSQTDDKQAFLDEIHPLEYALPKGKKRKAAEDSDREHMKAAQGQADAHPAKYASSRQPGVDGALADRVYEQGTPRGAR